MTKNDIKMTLQLQQVISMLHTFPRIKLFSH